jgi:hypothetical protein
MCQPVRQYPQIKDILIILLVVPAAGFLAAADGDITSVPAWIGAVIGGVLVAGIQWGIQRRSVIEQGQRIMELCATVLRLEQRLVEHQAAVAADRTQVAVTAERLGSALERIEEIEQRCDRRHTGQMRAAAAAGST